MTPTASAIEELLGAQAGVLSRAQARAAGLSVDAVDRILAARRWLPVQPRVYRDAAHPDTVEAGVRAAVLWAGADAVLSGAAAAWWWGLPIGPPGTVTVTVPRRRAPRPRDGIVVRRRALDPADVTAHRGVPVTGRALAALEAAVELGGAGGAALLDRVLAAPPGADRLDPARLVAAHARNVGARGSAAAGELLAGALRRARAGAAHRIRAALVRARIGGWRCDHPVAGVVVPLAFPAARVAVEVRSGAPAPATDATAVLVAGTGDEWRRAVLRRAGWRVLVLDPAEVLHRPGRVVAAVRYVLTDRPPGPGLPSAAG
ncbi:hypothetical protein ACLFMI_02455 [Pseudonocardia nantongensis]|uniref:hypothetical protein n=1 Tax=Pseudonocardia nantongensis TaxID=1181885 RepID=UPI00397CCED6